MYQQIIHSAVAVITHFAKICVKCGVFAFVSPQRQEGTCWPVSTCGDLVNERWVNHVSDTVRKSCLVRCFHGINKKKPQQTKKQRNKAKQSKANKPNKQKTNRKNEQTNQTNKTKKHILEQILPSEANSLRFLPWKPREWIHANVRHGSRDGQIDLEIPTHDVFHVRNVYMGVS